MSGDVEKKRAHGSFIVHPRTNFPTECKIFAADASLYSSSIAKCISPAPPESNAVQRARDFGTKGGGFRARDSLDFAAISSRLICCLSTSVGASSIVRPDDQLPVP
ncbi:hypothetical protein K0M31_013469, partial [Melipona bicolor]